MSRAILLLLLATACSKDSGPPPSGRQAPKGLPPLERAPAPPPAAPAEVAVEGTIEVSAALAAKVKPGDVIFVTARPMDDTGAPGRTIAADRLEVKALPMAFSLTGAHRMSDQPLSGKMLVGARLDRDSEAMSREPGDLEGSLKVELPARGLKIVLDTEVAP